MRSRRTATTLLAARAASEGIAFASLAAVVHALVLGRSPLPLVPLALGLTGVCLVLVAWLRDHQDERQGRALVFGTLAVGGLGGLSLGMRDPDGLATLTRILAFGILSEGLLWRTLSLARGAARWNDARNAAPFAIVTLLLAQVVPNVDHTALPSLALVLIGTTVVALSLARSTEELLLADAPYGGASGGSLSVALLLVGGAAIVAALGAALLRARLDALGDASGPLFARAVFLLLLPLGYIAAWLVELIRPLVSRFGQTPLLPRTGPQRTPEEEEALLRQIEQNRPWVAGALEVLIAAVALVVALILIERIVRERRLSLPDGTALERDADDGVGLGASVASLLPRRPARRRRPRDDGTPAGALRLVYWRFLALAERAGAGWREPSETPAEHVARISAADRRWRAGAPLVSAFADLRYGERAPDLATVAHVRGILGALEDGVRV